MKSKLIHIFVFVLISLSYSFGDSVTVYIQNDVFLPNKRTDRYYTHGTRVEYKTTNLTTYSAGQFLYTPEDITNPNVILNDRPYSGWLYVGYGKEFLRENHADYFEFQLGVLGRYSFAEEVQTYVHEIIGSPEPKGWEHQIRDEVGFISTYQRRYRIFSVEDSFDILPQGGITLGTLHSGANVGTTIRVGRNLPSIFDYKSIEPVITQIREIQHIFIFARINCRYVAHNTSLEGSLFSWNESVHTKRAEPIVFELEYGLSLRVRDYSVNYSIVHKSKEFSEQRGSTRYGAITLSTFF